MGTHETKARELLLEHIRAPRPHIVAAVMAYREADQAITAATDLIALYGAGIHLVREAETLAAVLGEQTAQLRRTLAESMTTAGCTAVKLPDGAKAYVRDATRRAVIGDRDLIPVNYWSTPAPHPDLAAIAKALSQGQTVGGCHFSNGGPPVLVIEKAKS